MSDPSEAMSVLLIDDNDVDRMMGKRLAERSGFIDRYIDFASALDALAHLSEPGAPKYDVILVDHSMPQMDGILFLREAEIRLKEHLSKTVVVMLTTLVTDEIRAAAESTNMVRHFLTKPLSHDKIASLKTVTN